MSKPPCADDPEMFFPPKPTGPGARAAARICMTCSMFAACDALAEKIRPTGGVWAARGWISEYTGSEFGNPRPIDVTCSTKGCTNLPRVNARCEVCAWRSRKVSELAKREEAA